MRNVLLITGLAVLSTSAFASKARVDALGVGAGYYIADTRSVFSNPADLSGMKNIIVTEWGAANAADTAAAPRAEGGFFREMGTFTYGLYLGNNTTRSDRTTGFKSQDNAIDLFLAGDMGPKWGARVHYASQKDETGATAATNTKNDAFGLGLGGTHGDMGAYLNMDLSDKSTGDGTTATNESKLKPSYQLGVTYNWGGFNFYGEYNASKLEEKIAAVNNTMKNSTIVVGAGRTHEINPTSKIFSNAMLSFVTSDSPANSPAGKTTTNTLPVTLGMETEATSWLIVRGSVSQNVFLSEVKYSNGKKKTVAGSTAVNAGATLNFGKLKVDGMIGNTDVSRAGTIANKGVLSTDNLLTRVGVSYAF